jgi:hypothetical protein
MSPGQRQEPQLAFGEPECRAQGRESPGGGQRAAGQILGRHGLVDQVTGQCRAGLERACGWGFLAGVCPSLGYAVLMWLASCRPSSVIDVWRILNFCIFPVTVIGKSEVNLTYSGTL